MNVSNHEPRLRPVLRPGVVLFQRLSFTAKAVLISCVLTLPVLMLGTLFVMNRLEDVRFTEHERRGSDEARGWLKVMRGAQQLRGLALAQASGADPGQVAASEAGRGVREGLAILRPLVPVGSARKAQLDVIEQAVTSQVAASESLFKAYSSHGKLAAILATAVHQTADDSGLMLDPVMESYYLMVASINELPAAMEQAARMGALSAASSRAGQGGEVVAAELARLDALVEMRFGEALDAVHKVGNADPALKAVLDTAPAQAALSRLRDAATDQPGGGGVQQAEKVQQALDAAMGALEQLQAGAHDQLDVVLQRRLRHDRMAVLAVLAIITVCMVVGAYLFLSFYFVLAGGFSRLRNYLSAMSQGDLSRSLHAEGTDEVAQLTRCLAEAQSSFSRMVGEVRDQAEHIATSSNEIASGAADLSQRAEHAASALQQSASSIEQIGATVQSTAEHAARASTIASENAAAAERGGAAMTSMERTFGDIRSASDRIGEIVSVIESIAFQTNILALNAAVEAARAGEYGRGFAVVASEVRALAKRSSESAAEIKHQIEDSVRTVGEGHRVLQETGAAIRVIVENAAQIHRFLGDISRGTHEQSGGVQLVASSVSELDHVTQQNSSLAEQTAAASGTLKEVSGDLLRQVSRFKLAVD